MKNIGIIIGLLFIGLANVNAQNWDTTSLIDINHGIYNDITFINASHGYIIGDSNLFLETKDAGKTWVHRSPLEDFTNPNRRRNKDLKQIFFLNDTMGFMRSSYEFFQTRNAGETWEVAISNNGGFISMELFNNQLTVFSDQAFGTLLTSVYSEEHDTFSYQGGGLFPVYTIEKLLRLSDSIIIVGKDTGCIFIYNVNSRKITKTYDPADDGLGFIKIKDIFFLNQDTGFASLNYIFLKKTVDGGKTWFTDTTFNNASTTVATTKVFSLANGELYVNSIDFPATNFIHKYNRNTRKWEYETEFKDNNLGFGYDNYAGIAGNGTGLFTVFEKDILGYKTDWNYIKSIKKSIREELKVYPNPSNGLINIEQITKTIGSQYSIYSLDGKLLEDGIIKDRITKVKIENAGMYFLVLKSNGSIIGHSKIIIE